MTLRFSFIAATAVALVATSFALCPTASAQAGAGAHQKTETLATRATRRAIAPVPIEAFGALAGAAASIAAAQQRETYAPYYSPYSAPYVFERSRRPRAAPSVDGAEPRLVTRPAAGTL